MDEPAARSASDIRRDLQNRFRFQEKQSVPRFASRCLLVSGIGMTDGALTCINRRIECAPPMTVIHSVRETSFNFLLKLAKHDSRGHHSWRRKPLSRRMVLVEIIYCLELTRSE